MQFKYTRQIFNKGDSSNKTTITLTDNMLAGVNEFIRVTGSSKSVPEVAIKVLEQFLVQMVYEGVIKLPPGEEENYKAIVESWGYHPEAKRDAS